MSDWEDIGGFILDPVSSLNPFSGTSYTDVGFDLLSPPEQPAAPDYTGAAEATAAGNLELAEYTTDVNRPDQYTPFGSSTWTQGEELDQAAYDAAMAEYGVAPSESDYWTKTFTTVTEPAGEDDYFGQNRAVEQYLTEDKTFDQSSYDAALAEYQAGLPQEADYMTPTNQWTQTTTLDPAEQALLDQQRQTDLLGGDLAYQGLMNTEDMFSTPFQTGLDPMGSFEDQRDSLVEAMMARTTEDVAQQRDAKRSELIAQGIPVNSEAFDREMKRFERQLTDAKQQSELYATDQISKMLSDDRATRNQTIAELLTERQTPLNELSALTSGAPVTNPAFDDFYSQQQILGPDYLGAETAKGAWDLAGWNADVARSNAIYGGLFDLGAAGIAA